MFNLTVTLHPTRMYVAVIGADYWEGPHSNHPKRKSLDFDRYAVTFAKHLVATGVLNLSSPFNMLDCQRGRIERWDRVKGLGWRRHFILEQFEPCPPWPRSPDYLAWADELRKTPANASKYLAAPDIYRHLSELGKRIPGIVADFSIFSHAWHGGPILYNTGSWTDLDRKDRYEGDLDMRYHQDFDAPKVRGWPKMPAAFVQDARTGNVVGTVRVWGCFDVDDYDAMVRDLLSNSKARFKRNGYDLDRAGVVAALKHAIDDQSYMYRIATFTGALTWGGLPSFGADTSNYDAVLTLWSALRREVDGQILYVPVTTARSAGARGSVIFTRRAAGFVGCGPD